MFGHSYAGNKESSVLSAAISTETYNRIYLQRADITEKVSFLPRRCYHSNKTLWFKKSYKTQALMFLSDELKLVTRWYDKSELTMITLKGD